MQQRVTAIVVVRSGADYLRRTLAALASQTRAPDSIVAVDVASEDRSREILAASSMALLSVPAATSFGETVRSAVAHLGPASSDDEQWLWFLQHDNAPAPQALEAMLAAVEIAPSVAVAGPKLMVWERPGVMADFGETMTRTGASVPLVESELDQAQHDADTDVLGVAAQGMLVRREVFEKLGGFDRGLPTVDAGLDLSVRARYPDIGSSGSRGHASRVRRRPRISAGHPSADSARNDMRAPHSCTGD